MSKQIQLDEKGKPRRVWINSFPQDDIYYINTCNADEPHQPAWYGMGDCMGKCSTVIEVHNPETLVALYNALHEALFEHELERK